MAIHRSKVTPRNSAIAPETRAIERKRPSLHGVMHAVGAALALFVCLTTSANAGVAPVLQVFATTTTACATGQPGVTVVNKQGVSGSFCTGVNIDYSSYGLPGVTFSGSAKAEALPIFGSFTLSASANGSMQGAQPCNAQGIHSAATGFMYFELAEKSPAPFAADIPVQTLVNAGMSVTGNAGASLLVTIDGLDLFRKSANGTSQPVFLPFEEKGQWYVAPNSGVHSIFKAVSCGVIAGANVSGDCTASLDPVLSFDQSAFDTQWGAASFSLEDYYTIQVSANLVPVPEPQTYALLLIGAALLGWRVQRKALR